MPVDMPHLDDVAPLKQSADRTLAEPLRQQLREARSLILQQLGHMAAADVEVPASLEKQVYAWLHQQASEGARG